MAQGGDFCLGLVPYSHYFDVPLEVDILGQALFSQSAEAVCECPLE